MVASSANNKLIVKNTIVLYARMVVVLLISLFTSRIVLKALGVEDFGLFGVIGGLIGLFAFLQSSLSKATQRFLNVEMVAENGSLKDVFRTSWTIHLLIVLVIIVLAETIGLLFLNSKINIPQGREFAAGVIFQTTVISLCLSVLQTPFNASVVAHEDMTFFAIVSIAETILKLVIAYMILKTSYNHLIVYGILLTIVSLLSFSAYYLYCSRKYKEISILPLYNKQRFGEVFGFVSWTLVGQIAIVGCTQGTSVLMNMFHSVIANAALTVGNQVSNAVTNLSSNFQMAFNPQITKLYAEHENNELKKLVFTTSKISFCLLFVVSLPLCLNIDFILDIWLDKVPKFSNIFCVLLIANNIINALSAPLNFCVLSSGNIKWFQIVTAAFYLTDIAIVYILFKNGYPPVTALWVKVVIMFAILLVRLFFANRVIPEIDLVSYSKSILLPLGFVTAISTFLGLLLAGYFNTLFIRLTLTTFVFLVSLFLIWFFALNKEQRIYIKKLIKR